MMEAYWKIPKVYINELHLTPAEALVLADIKDWQGYDGNGCTLEERAERVGMSKTSVFNILHRLKEKGIDVQKSEQKRSKKLNKNVQKSEQKSSKKLNKNVQKSEFPPYNPPYIEKQEEQGEHEYSSTPTSLMNARDDEEKRNGVVKETQKLVEEIKEEIANGGTFAQSALRLYGIQQEQLIEYLTWFVDHLNLNGVTIKSRGDFRRHFNSWLRIQAEKNLKRQHNNAKHKPSDEFLAEIFADITSGK